MLVRIRPTAKFAHEMIDLQPDNKTVNIHCQRDMRRGVVNNQVLDWSFRLDGVLHNASQEQVFDTVATDVVSSTMNGYNGTVMCYGQTGAGKTFTMTGATENYKHRGVIPRAIAQLFKEVENRPEQKTMLWISYMEIYNETMIDLLTTLPAANNHSVSPMTVVEDSNGVHVKGLSTHLAQTEEEALNFMFEGETNRAIAEHSLNKQSSRSHCIFTLYVESRSRVHSDARYTMSKVNFVDLAGSERLGKTQSVGITQQEAMYINKSLSFLEQTVIALADRRREHVPFRQTKLTHCLKDSIGGNCNTILVANIWGEESQLEETISTLRFATRMMCVASQPAVNEHYDPAIMVKKLEGEIGALKRELAMHDTLTNRSHISYEPLSEQQGYEIQQQVRQYLQAELDEVDIVNVRQIQGVFEAFRDIVRQLDRDTEEKFRERYTLVDKTDPAAIAAAQAAGIPVGDDGELVGELDGASFGVGTASPGARPVASTIVNSKRKDKKGSKGRGDQKSISNAPSPAYSSKADGSGGQTPSGEKDEKRDEAGTPTSMTGKETLPPKPSTPPSRSEAFDEFKQERGSEINRILTENKEILESKKNSYKSLAQQINYTKEEIDKSRGKLSQYKQEREDQGPMTNEDGDVIITEAEFLEIKRLQDLKKTYQDDFDELKHLRSEVHYCEKLVSQCRQKLIQEFDNWYTESFLVDQDMQTSRDAGVGHRAGTYPPQRTDTIILEDEQEKFDRLQMALLMENPDSAAFYNAKMRTQRRKTYESSMSQAQPAMSRKPGTPVRSLRTRPPQTLTVQN